MKHSDVTVQCADQHTGLIGLSADHTHTLRQYRKLEVYCKPSFTKDTILSKREKYYLPLPCGSNEEPAKDKVLSSLKWRIN